MLRSMCLGIIAFATLAGLVHWRLRASLPLLDGTLLVKGLRADVTIERDLQGVPTINSESRIDTAFALGFLHAQERFFQMDLLRRMSSGEISELFGAVALPLDEKFRKHRFQATAAKVLNDLPEPHRALINAYSDGVNHGLSKLGAPSFEFTLLRVSPKPWRSVDCIHVMLTMLADLQQIDAENEIDIGLLKERVPSDVFDFLIRKGSSWDAPLDGSMMQQPPIPPEAIWSLRSEPDKQSSGVEHTESNPTAFLFPRKASEQRAASNNWAVGSDLGKDKRAILASDMHLGLQVPTVWYRAVMNTPCLDGKRRRLVGVTLPGTPTLVEGSNGSVAWGLTNSYGDFGDVIELVPVDGEPDQYVTPDGPKSIERFKEEIAYPGGSKKIEYEWSIWGPIVAKRDKRRFAHRWVGDDPRANDMLICDLETAQSTDSAIRSCNEAGMPHLNVVIADRDGNIGWTLCGRIPTRSGPPPRSPVDWSKGGQWSGYLATEDYPKLVNPKESRIWTANNRVVGGDFLSKIGDGGYDLGARARQIRDLLRNKTEFDERDMLAIQLDNEALFLAPWRELLMKAVQGNERSLSTEFMRFVQQWEGRASTNSVGYRIVRTFRIQVANHFFETPRAEKNAVQRFGSIPKRAGIKRQVPMAHEDVLWQLLMERPLHWLPLEFASWDALLLDAAKSTEKEMSTGQPMAKATWGASNMAEINHPLSMGLPIVTGWLGMPNLQLPGDNHMPRVQRPGFGASQRMVVSPGFEEKGIYHQPGGQSGHPYSPYYKSGYDDWANGNASTLLPGPTKYILRLVPQKP